MKILIAVGSKEFSGPTLQVGMKVAKAFNASTTIVDVGKKIGKFDSKVAVLAQERMESWEFERPGVDVLEWAFQYLEKNNFIESQIIEAGFPKNTLVETGASRAEVYLKGTVCEDVKLILRNGNIISELRDDLNNKNHMWEEWLTREENLNRELRKFNVNIRNLKEEDQFHKTLSNL